MLLVTYLVSGFAIVQFAKSLTIADTTMFSFSTKLQEDTTTSESTVLFSVVDLNVGDGYDEFTGK